MIVVQSTGLNSLKEVTWIYIYICWAGFEECSCSYDNLARSSMDLRCLCRWWFRSSNQFIPPFPCPLFGYISRAKSGKKRNNKSWPKCASTERKQIISCPPPSFFVVCHFSIAVFVWCGQSIRSNALFCCANLLMYIKLIRIEYMW